MEHIDYAPLLPSQPKEPLGPWLQKKGVFQKQRTGWATTIAKVTVAGKTPRLAVLCWKVNLLGGEQYLIQPYEGYVVKERRTARVTGRASTGWYNWRMLGRWEMRQRYCDQYGEVDHIYPWRGSLLHGTTAENCKLNVYLRSGGKYPVSYLALWRKHPAAENLVMQGFVKFLDMMFHSEIHNNVNGYGFHVPCGVPKLSCIDWTQVKPAKMFGLTREELSALNKPYLRPDTLRKYKLVREALGRVPLDTETLSMIFRNGEYQIERILEEQHHTEFWRILRYLDKQKMGYSALYDYWSMAKAEGRNLADGLVRYPRDLDAAHRKQIEAAEARRKAKEAADLEARIAKRAGAFAARAVALSYLAYEQGGLLIRPCADERELIREGNELHHCVARYAADIASGKTAIFFIRRSEKPDEPYFTLELDEKKLTVRQNRGLHNCDRTPEVEQFERQWLAWAKTQVRKARRKVTAA